MRDKKYYLWKIQSPYYKELIIQSISGEIDFQIQKNCILKVI